MHGIVNLSMKISRYNNNINKDLMQALSSSRQIFKQIACSNILQRALCSSPATEEKLWQSAIYRLKASNLDDQVLPEIHRKFNQVIGSDAVTKKDIQNGIYQFYNQLSKHHKVSFLALLYNSLQVTTNEALGSNEGNSKIPLYQWIFQQMKYDSEGVKFLIDCRAALLDHVRKNKNFGSIEIPAMEKSLKSILREYFATEHLKVRTVRKDDDKDLKEKLIEYEAVHAYRDDNDLEQRIGLNRRCFILTHNQLPGEPLAILHTELTDKATGNIHDIIDRSTNEKERIERILVAIFYSVSVTNKGLSGFQFGQYIIKKAVGQLQEEFPRLREFFTLSPIPGFRKWLLNELRKKDKSQYFGLMQRIQNTLNKDGVAMNVPGMLELLQSKDWQADKESVIIQGLKETLLPLCACYLTLERNRNRAINPVANFHIGNGACIYRLNWLADLTNNGMQSSLGIMVNYQYILKEMQYHTQRYYEHGQIGVSNSIQDYIEGSCPVNKPYYIARKSKL